MLTTTTYLKTHSKIVSFAMSPDAESLHSGYVGDVIICKGMRVKEDQVLMEIETLKATVKETATFCGVIDELYVREGDFIKDGALLYRISKISFILVFAVACVFCRCVRFLLFRAFLIMIKINNIWEKRQNIQLDIVQTEFSCLTMTANLFWRIASM